MARIPIHTLLLALILVLVHTVAARHYTINNINTKSAIANIGMGAGNDVQTTTDTPLVEVLTIDPNPDSASHVTATIFDEQSGLYVGVDQEISGSRLVWVPHEYQWNIAKTSYGKYVIFPVGHDLFAVSKSTISPYVELIPGRDIQGDEGFWSISNVEP